MFLINILESLLAIQTLSDAIPMNYWIRPTVFLNSVIFIPASLYVILISTYTLEGENLLLKWLLIVFSISTWLVMFAVIVRYDFSTFGVSLGIFHVIVEFLMGLTTLVLYVGLPIQLVFAIISSLFVGILSLIFGKYSSIRNQVSFVVIFGIISHYLTISMILIASVNNKLIETWPLVTSLLFHMLYEFIIMVSLTFNQNLHIQWFQVQCSFLTIFFAMYYVNDQRNPFTIIT